MCRATAKATYFAYKASQVSKALKPSTMNNIAQSSHKNFWKNVHIQPHLYTTTCLRNVRTHFLYMTHCAKPLSQNPNQLALHDNFLNLFFLQNKAHHLQLTTNLDFLDQIQHGNLGNYLFHLFWGDLKLLSHFHLDSLKY